MGFSLRFSATREGGNQTAFIVALVCRFFSPPCLTVGWSASLEEATPQPVGMKQRRMNYCRGERAGKVVTVGPLRNRHAR
jgi:hypothetical protein